MEKIIKELVDNQRAYFNTGITLDLDFRITQLKKDGGLFMWYRTFNHGNKRNNS